MLPRRVADVAQRPYRHRRIDQTAAHQRGVVGVATHGLDPLRPLRCRVVHRRHALAQHEAADVRQPGHGPAERRIPEGFEMRVHAGDRRTGDEDVAVAEVVGRVPVVIVVLVVAAAGDAHQPVHHHQLVVHALVEPAPATSGRQRVHRVADPRAAQHRVVEAHLEIRVRAGQRRQGVDAPQRGQLVDQQPHLHPAPRRDQQLVEDQMAGVVLVEDVGLDIDAAGGAADQIQTRQQRVLAVVEDQRVVLRAGRCGHDAGSIDRRGRGGRRIDDRRGRFGRRRRHRHRRRIGDRRWRGHAASGAHAQFQQRRRPRTVVGAAASVLGAAGGGDQRVHLPLLRGGQRGAGGLSEDHRKQAQRAQRFHGSPFIRRPRARAAAARSGRDRTPPGSSGPRRSRCGVRCRWRARRSRTPAARIRS